MYGMNIFQKIDILRKTGNIILKSGLTLIKIGLFMGYGWRI